MPTRRRHLDHAGRWRRLCAAVLLACALVIGAPTSVVAQQMAVPANLQVPLLLKILTYDRNLASRPGDALTVGIVFRAGDAESERAAGEVAAVLDALTPRKDALAYRRRNHRCWSDARRRHSSPSAPVLSRLLKNPPFSSRF